MEHMLCHGTHANARLRVCTKYLKKRIDLYVNQPGRVKRFVDESGRRFLTWLNLPYPTKQRLLDVGSHAVGTKTALLDVERWYPTLTCSKFYIYESQYCVHACLLIDQSSRLVGANCWLQHTRHQGNCNKPSRQLQVVQLLASSLSCMQV